MKARIALATMIAGLAFLAGGCVYSEKGLAIPGQDDSIFEPWLIGEWEVPETGPFAAHAPPRRVRIVRADPRSNGYRFIELPERRADAALDALREIRLYRLGEALFLDVRDPLFGVFLGSAEPDDRELKASTLPHLIIRVRIKGERFVLENPDEKFFKDNLDAIPHKREVEGIARPRVRMPGRVRITATPEELRAFLMKYGKDDAAWSEDRELFVRVGPQPSAQSPQPGKP